MEEIKKEKERLVKEGKIKKEKKLPEIGEDEVPFDIPENWRWVRLQEAAQTIIDCPHSTPKYYDEVTGFYAIGTKCLNGRGEITKLFNVDSETYKKRVERLVPQENDVVYSREGSIICRAVLLPSDKKICLGQRVMLIRCSGGLDPIYIQRYLMMDTTITTLTKNYKGVGVKHINVADVITLSMPLPPLAEQHRIVDKVNTLMTQIDFLKRIEDELTTIKSTFPSTMRDSILQAAMQGKLTERLESDGTAEELYIEIQEEKKRLIKEGKIKKEKALEPISEDEIPFDIPENWKWVRLGNVGSFTRGNGIKRGELTETGFPCVRYGQLYTTYKTSFSYPVSYTTKTIYDKSIKVKETNVLMALTGENNYDIALAVAYLGEEEIAMGGDMTKFSHIIDPMYIVCVMNSLFAIQQKSKLATGNIIVHISNDKLATILFPLPPLAEQHRIVARLNELLPLCDTLEEAKR